MEKPREIHVLRCGDEAASLCPENLPLPIHECSAIPTRSELSFISELKSRLLPTDPTPTLDEIAAQPDVAHLGAPAADPRANLASARIIVIGSDAALAAVATKIMRIDATWIELAFIPTSPDSPIATSWGLEGSLWSLALTGSVRPIPLIRDDSSLVTLGIAEICSPTSESFVGEIITDATTMSTSHDQLFGVRLAATTTAPGIASVCMIGPSEHSTDRSEGSGASRESSASEVAGGGRREEVAATRRRGKFFSRFSFGQRQPSPRGATDPHSLVVGRAVQAGGQQFLVVRDGIAHPRLVDRVTFYRHLRDLQAVRP